MTAFEAHVADATPIDWPVLGARAWSHAHSHPPVSGDWHHATEGHLHTHVRGGGVDRDHHPIKGDALAIRQAAVPPRP